MRCCEFYRKSSLICEQSPVTERSQHMGMTRKTKIILKNVCLGLACMVTSVAFFRSAEDNPGIGNLFVLLWGSGPYLLFWLATYLLERFSSVPQVPGIGFGLSILIALYAFAVYLEPLDHQSSTEGLIYLFAPLWLYFSVLPLLGICVLIAWLSNRQRSKESSDKPAN